MGTETMLPITWTLAVVYANIVMYSICFMMQQPLLPYLVDKLGASTAQFATMQSYFNGAQAVGGLLSGPILDAFGGRMLLLVSFGVSVFSYALTASATNLTMLYLSRVTTVLQHAVLAARTIVAASTQGHDRALHLGYVSMCIGVGMSSGPLIGGLLSDISLQFSAWMAVIGSALSFFSILLLVPSDAPGQKTASLGGKQAASPAETTAIDTDGPSESQAVCKDGVNGVHKVDGAVAGADGKASMAPGGSSKVDDGSVKPAASLKGRLLSMLIPTQFMEVVASPGVPSLMTIKLVSNMASNLFQSMFTVILKNQGLGPKYTGAAMSSIGFCSIFVQACVVGPAIKNLGESRTLYFSLWGLMSGFLILAASKGVAMTIVSLIPQCIAGVLISTVSTAQLTKAVPNSRAGTALALDMGLWSMVRMAAPGLGAHLLSTLGASALGGASAMLMAALLGAIQLGMVAC